MIDPWRSQRSPVEWCQILAIDDMPNLASRVPVPSQHFLGLNEDRSNRCVLRPMSAELIALSSQTQSSR